VGCGSGILGIAARKLGAGRVVMIDNDPVAVQVAAENAAKNGVPDLEVSETPVGAVTERFPLVVANILAFTLIDLRAEIAATVVPGGELLLSGILSDQADEVARAFEQAGMRHLGTRLLGDWALVRMAG
jgi:ribosomal protein L11 methyltransferase